MAVVTVAFSDLDTWLSNQPDNTADTPYELNITGLTVNDCGSAENRGTLGYVIKEYGKYVDLSNTDLPSTVTDMTFTFSGCTSLVSAPVIPNSVTRMGATFRGCTSLVNAPTIPNSVFYLYLTFGGCTSLVSAPAIPNSVINMVTTFSGCISLVNAPVIPNGVTDMTSTFSGCTSLVSAPSIPNSVYNMSATFRDCTSLVNAPIIPNSVTNMYSAFEGCSLLCYAPTIPSSVTNMKNCFKGCTSLRKIDNFQVSLSTLDSANAQDCFKNCTALTQVGYTNESEDWHLWKLTYDNSTVEGKVFHRDGTYDSIPQTSITKTDLQLPVLTDELWFPTESDSDIDTIIAKMLQYHYGVFKKEVIPPDQKSFVLMADDPDNVISNILGGEGSGIKMYETLSDLEQDLPNLEVGALVGTNDGINFNTVDEVTSGVYNPVTSNAVAEKVSYSTSEQLTGGKWIDGKPIYRKVVDCGTLPNATSKTIAHNIANISRIINAKGIAYRNDSNTFIQLPFVSTNFVEIQFTLSSISITTRGNYSNYREVFITIEYTKTTD